MTAKKVRYKEREFNLYVRDPEVGERWRYEADREGIKVSQWIVRTIQEALADNHDELDAVEYENEQLRLHAQEAAARELEARRQVEDSRREIELIRNELAMLMEDSILPRVHARD